MEIPSFFDIQVYIQSHLCYHINSIERHDGHRIDVCWRLRKKRGLTYMPCRVWSFSTIFSANNIFTTIPSLYRSKCSKQSPQWWVETLEKDREHNTHIQSMEHEVCMAREACWSYTFIRPIELYLDDAIAPSIFNTFWYYKRDIFTIFLVQPIGGLISLKFSILGK